VLPARLFAPATVSKEFAGMGITLYIYSIRLLTVYSKYLYDLMNTTAQ
jgi:hypothetical protein